MFKWSDEIYTSCSPLSVCSWEKKANQELPFYWGIYHGGEERGNDAYCISTAVMHADIDAWTLIRKIKNDV